MYMGNAMQDHLHVSALAWRAKASVALAMLFVANFACAVTLNPRGVGQALVYPYYTVNNS